MAPAFIIRSRYAGATRCHMVGEFARYVIAASASEHHLLANLLANPLIVCVPLKRIDLPLLPNDGKIAGGTGVEGLTTVVIGV
jgi:hypothetical protein